MEHYRISKLSSNSKKWILVNYLSSGQYSVSKYSAMLRSKYSNAYIAVKGRISVGGTNNANARNKKLTFKNNPPFRSCILKINNTYIDNKEDLDIVIPVYNLLEYSENYSKTSGSLWNYYRDEVNDSANENNDANNFTINNNKTATSKSLEYKINDNNILEAEVVAPLKYFSNFWRSLDLYLINCEIELDLKWSKNCVISEILRTPSVPEVPPVPKVEATQTTGTTFQIYNAKPYVTVVMLSINDNIKFLENIKQGTNIDLK